MKTITITKAPQKNGFFINTKFVLLENWEISKNRFSKKEQTAFEKQIINNIDVDYKTVNYEQ